MLCQTSKNLLLSNKEYISKKEAYREKNYLYLENPSNNILLSASGCHQRSHFIEFLYLFKIIMYNIYITQVIHNLKLLKYHLSMLKTRCGLLKMRFSLIKYKQN